MGRPINDRFLGDFVAKSGFQVSAVVHVDAGEGPEPGNILRQRSNNKYLVEGVNSSEQLVCKLVAELEPALGEMSVSVFSDEKGLVTLIENQDETDYDGSGDNGTFAGGAGHDASDVLTLSNGASITVDAISSGLQVTNGQDETAFDNAGGNGTFVAGTGYSTSDVITLSNNTEVTVDNVGGGGEVTEFTVTAIGTPTTAGTTLTQDSVAPAGGSGFTLTVEAPNLENVGDITQFTVTDGGDPVTAGSTLTQASTDGSGTGFELTIDADNDEPLPEFARNINNRTVKTFLGNVYAWPVNADVTSRTDINIQGQ